MLCVKIIESRPFTHCGLVAPYGDIERSVLVIVRCLTTERHYRKTSNISRALVGNKIVDNSDVVGAST